MGKRYEMHHEKSFGTLEQPLATAGPPIEASKPAKPKPVGSRPSKFQQLNKLYGLPAPIRTFPLPTLIPHNPLSLFHILYVWLSQTISRPSSHFDSLYQGWFSPETRSIHKRRGVSKAIASEDVTRKRRADRQHTKWERARKEREAIDQTLLAEAKANELQNTNIIVATEEKIAVQVDNLSAPAEQEPKLEAIEEPLSSSLSAGKRYFV
ncbi:hypothetical protein DID88_004708 [Monilinia fructigena]|uniref:Uncharacterized protein n=1 Tax=Monilinia fructigena TaxID=38457 RepID=A0A395IRD1_9HELO|nr:hypothetical protein DID88_004708 [Monilinia fructigena]